MNRKLYLGSGTCRRTQAGSTVIATETLACVAPSDRAADDWGRAQLLAKRDPDEGWADHASKMHPVARHQVASWLAAYDYDVGVRRKSDQEGA